MLFHRSFLFIVGYFLGKDWRGCFMPKAMYFHKQKSETFKFMKVLDFKC